MIGALVLTMVLFSLIQGDRASLIFTIPCAIVFLIGTWLPGSVYFHICAIVDLAIMLELLKIKSKLSISLAVCCMISMILNLLGYILWVTYADPATYLFSFLIYYAVIIYLLATRGSRVGHSCFNSLFHCNHIYCVGADRGGEA